MKIIDDAENKMKTSSNKKYIPLYYDSFKYRFKVINKLIISIIIFITLLLILFFIIKSNKKQIKTILPNKSLNDYFFKKLKLILEKEEILENEFMNQHTTFQLGGPAKYFVKPKSINKIIEIIRLCKEYSIEYFILGNGSNLLVSDKGYDGLVINIHEDNFSDLKVEQIDDTHYKITVGGGILMRTLAKRLCLLSLSGLEDIIDIPGTIGGGIIMNASAGGKGLIFNSLENVKVITPDGEIKELSKNECELRARGSKLKDNKYMVIEAKFNLVKDDKFIIQKTMADHTSRRYGNQPMYFLSAGCFFIWIKQNFGSLYQKYKENNLVGYRVGDAMVYPYNIAFIVNLGNATSSDVYSVVTHIENVIKNKYNIDIKREVVVLGSF